KLWNPSTTQAEQLGYAYTYDEQGSLIAEVGSGGTNSAGQASYIYLPTGNGPMPIAAVINGNTYAIHSDHLNTPRRLTNADGQAVWQWTYSAFGEDKPTTARNRFANTETAPNPGTTSIAEVKFNLRYPGQYSDDESGLFYNYFRSYDARTGRYSQPDPIGLDGGWNRFGYVDEDPLDDSDAFGLASDNKRANSAPPAIMSPTGGRLSKGDIKLSEIPLMGGRGGGGRGGSLSGGGRGGIAPIAGGGAKLGNITPGEARRIQNAADRTGVPICLVGSRASGKTRPGSDWDYVIPERTTNSKIHSLESSLPEGHRGLGEGRNQDFLRDDSINSYKPFIYFTPGPKRNP
ncbi:RHS repeat domain-containing protein, partial [Variovorax sp. Root434]|uniref:RHS repeat domain-containing protein n=1 Tax=Variovorax sp. Root434 TaxID=1736536 RepID=UPI001910ABE4